MCRFLLIGIIAVLLSSCGARTGASQEEGDTLHLKYSSLLTIVRHDGFTQVDIRNPWKEGKLLHTYILVPRSSQLPAHLPHGTVVRTPVERAAVFTTVHCSLLATIGRADRIVGVADLKYIKIPYVQQQVREGRIADCGSGMNPMVEKIIDVKPDVILLSPFENSGGYGKLEEIDVPLVECAEYMETSPLARAEWMKFYGMLFGKEQTTDSLFAVVDNNYQSLRQDVRQLGAGRSVVLDKMVGTVWYVPGGRSTIGQMVQDAGGRYPWANDPHSGSLSLAFESVLERAGDGGRSTIGQMVQDAGGRYPWADDSHSGSLSLAFESVLERAGDADVWMYRYSSDHSHTFHELLSEYHGYRQLQAFADRNVYACNVEQTLFYEESPFRPDYLLSDFIQILHPDTPNPTPLRYYQKLHE